jgi:antirestriction protein ArdC
VAYIQHWKDQIKADPKLVVTAAGRAQKAVDFILGENQPKVDETGVEFESEAA